LLSMNGQNFTLDKIKRIVLPSAPAAPPASPPADS
jgi:hypothetical protein